MAEAPGLLKLPAELKTEIVKWLSWEDVLQVRKFKPFAEVTKIRQIWAHLVREHISSKLFPPSLERPLGKYSSSELENLLLRWKGAELGWKTDDGQPANERSFPCSKSIATHLLPGGRWYLTTEHQTGAVKYYDLDAETISGVELIPPQAVACLDEDLFVALDVDTESSHLKFSMAFSMFDRGPSPKPIGPFSAVFYKAIHIWRVGCIFDDFGHVIGLSATQVAKIPHPPNFGFVCSLSLRGQDIAFRGWHRVIVMEWDRADRERLYRLQVLDDFYPNNTSVFLLPKSRVLCQTAWSIGLYDYSDVQPTTDLSWDTDYHLNWSRHYVGNNYPKDILKAYSFANITKVIVGTAGSLISLTFEDDAEKPPPIVKIMALPKAQICQSRRLSLGYNHGIIFGLDKQVCQLIAYTHVDWDKPVMRPSSNFKHLSSALPPVYPDPVMDEDTGRIVIARSVNTLEADVVDFSVNRVT